MSEVGRRVVVHLEDGSTVEGWHFGNTPLGYYVALDRDATNIRFVPKGSWSSASYPDLDDKDKIKVESLVDQFYREGTPERNQVALGQDVRQALDHVDFNRIRRLSLAFESLRSSFAGSYGEMNLHSENRKQAVDTVVDTRSQYLELASELERSNLVPVLLENSETIRKERLPRVEWDWARNREERFLVESMHYRAIEKPSLTRDAGRQQLQSVDVSLIVNVLSQLEREQRQDKSTKSHWPRRLRVIAAAGKMAVGGALATANIAAGVTVGVLAALPTLGVGAIAGAVGIATSCYTGLNAACDGIKDLASAVQTG
jgi:hypothetical protein